MLLVAGTAFAFVNKWGPFAPAPLTCTPRAHTTLIFFDRSASAQADAATSQEFDRVIREEVQRGMQCAGDVIVGLHLHAATPGKAGSARYQSTAPSRPLTGTTGDTLFARSNYRSAVDNDVQRARTLLTQVAQSDLEPSLRRWTDILGAIQIIEGERKSGQTVRAVFLSDMHESMSGAGRRDFDTRPPSSTQEAIEWANADVEVVKATYLVGDDALSDVTIRPVRGMFASTPAATYIRAYWDTLWGAFGVDNVEW